MKQYFNQNNKASNINSMKQITQSILRIVYFRGVITIKSTTMMYCTIIQSRIIKFVMIIIYCIYWIVLFYINANDIAYASVASMIDEIYNNIEIKPYYNSAHTPQDQDYYWQSQSSGINVSANMQLKRNYSEQMQTGFNEVNLNASYAKFDLYSGADSYLSSSNLIRTLQNSLPKFASLLFINSLKSISPSLAGSIMSFLDSSQNMLNIANNTALFNSYLAPLNNAYTGQAFNNLMMASNIDAKDSINAIERIANKGDRGTIVNKWKQVFNNEWKTKHGFALRPELDGMHGLLLKQMADNFGSVVWKGMQQINQQLNYGTKEIDMANLIMSLIGEVILISQDDSMLTASPKFYPPLLNVADLYEGIGYNQKIYNCTGQYSPNNPKECVTELNHLANIPHININTAFREKVILAINNLQDFFTSNGKKSLHADTKKIIAISHFPIFQFAQICSDLGFADQIAFILDGYSQEIAFHIAKNVINDAMQLAMCAINARPVNNMHVMSSVNQLARNIDNVKSRIYFDEQKYKRSSFFDVLTKINFLKSIAHSSYNQRLFKKAHFIKALR